LTPRTSVGYRLLQLAVGYALHLGRQRKT